jgi:hypothetical protein
LINNGGGSVSCAACPSGQVQSLDGFSCVICNTACSTCSSTTAYLTDQTTQGFRVNRSCVQCDAAASILINGNTCGSCQPYLFVDSDTIASPTSVQCNDPNIFAAGGLLILNVNSAFSVQNFYFSAVFGSDTFTSWYFSQNLIPAFRTCARYSKRNVTSCQALANLCVLNLYNSYAPSLALTDACSAFNSLVKTSNGQTTNVIWGDNMPWLYYIQSNAAFMTSYASSGINGNGQFLGITFNSECSSDTLGFYAAKYTLGGKFVSFGPIDVSELQLCNKLRTGYGLASEVSPFSASNYQQSCSVSVASLLSYGSNAVFYDLYLKVSIEILKFLLI